MLTSDYNANTQFMQRVSYDLISRSLFLNECIMPICNRFIINKKHLKNHAKTIQFYVQNYVKYEITVQFWLKILYNLF